MKRLLLILLVLPSIGFAQFENPIHTDRFGNTLAPHTVGKKTVQVQAGYDFTRFAREGNIGIGLDSWGNSRGELTESNLSNANVKLRFGLGEKIEIFGVVGNLQTETHRNENKSLSDSRLLGFGYRMNLYEGKGAIPAVGFEASASFIDGADFIYFNLSLGNEIGNRLEIGANAQWFVEGSYFFTAQPRFKISKRFKAIAEYEVRFGSIQPFIFYPFDGSHHFASGGFTFHISENFVVDLLAGGMIGSPNVPGLERLFQLEGGLSYRLDWSD
jgi:hypothetical protein